MQKYLCGQAQQSMLHGNTLRGQHSGDVNVTFAAVSYSTVA